MTEIRKPTQVFTVHKDCDKCGRGEMKATGGGHRVTNWRWHHKCTICPAEESFDVQYPYHDFVETSI